MDNLESTLIRKFMNIDIQNYSYGDFEALFKLVEELVSRSFITYSCTIANTSIDSEYINISLNYINHQHSLDNKLSILLSLHDFIITDIEISIPY
jgi:hypothetical protein